MFSYSSAPLRYMAVLGALVAAGSFFMGAVYLANGIINGSQVEGWTTVIVLLAFLNGVAIAMLSMLGEYMVRTLRQVQMIPLRDIIPSRTRPVVTITLIALNALVFLYELSLGEGVETFIRTWGVVPARFSIVDAVFGPVFRYFDVFDEIADLATDQVGRPCHDPAGEVPPRRARKDGIGHHADGRFDVRRIDSGGGDLDHYFFLAWRPAQSLANW